MDTPTFQVPPARRRLPLDEALEGIDKGDLEDDVVNAFSDITRTDLLWLGSRWEHLPVEHREALIRRAIEWAERDVTKEFGRLYRVALSDDSEVIRQLAVIGLWEDQRPDLFGLLVDLAEADSSPDVRAEAVRTIGALLEMRDVDAISDDDVERVRDVLLDLAGDEGDTSILRRAAVEAIGGLGDDDEAEEILRFASTDDDAALQAAAVYAMGTTRGGEWQPIVVEALSSHDSDVRAAAVRAVGLIGIEDAVEVVAEAADAEDDEVRLAAIAALGALGTPPATRALRTLLQDPRADDLAALEAALDEAMIVADAGRADAGW